MADGFTGTGVALVTPFNTDKSIDYQSLERITNHVIDGGIDFIVALGTTGESVTLSKDERMELVQQLLKIVNNRIPLVVGMGGNNTMEVVNSILSANFDGISAILSVAPYYNKPTQQGLYEHFSAIAKVSPVPVILYNVPGRTATNINAETVLKLAKDHNKIIAVKEASGNFEQIKRIIEKCPSGFKVISGDDAATLQMIKEGGSGVISVAGNSHPELFSGMVRMALNGDYKAADSIHNKFLNYFDALFDEGNPTGIKSALENMQLCSKEVRLPLVSASKKLSSKMKGILSKLK